MDARRVLRGFALFVGVLFFLYFFLVSLDLLGSAFKVIAGDAAGSLFDAVHNPIAGLMVGILATVLVQSSSTTTSVIVSAVGSGVLDVHTAIPMVFGANIGTSVTNTIVSLGFVGDRKTLRLGFAGATVHDMFNYMNVIFWLPVEIIVNAINGGDGGPLFLLSEVLAKGFTKRDSEDWEGPLKVITTALVEQIIQADKDVTKDFAQGEPRGELCERLCGMKDVEGSNTQVYKCSGYKFHQKRCVKEGRQTFASPIESYCPKTDDFEKPSFAICIANAANKTFTVNTQAVADAVAHYEDFKINKGGVFAEKWGWQQEAGWFVLVLSLVMLVVCLIGMVKLLGMAVRGKSEEVLKNALNMNGYLAILVGCGVTMFVQSSSITTSVLTPFVAMGTLTVEGMLPLTLGANIGTTLTGVLAALVSESVLGMQIALVHVLFNVFGVILFYPVPFMRKLPLTAAHHLGDLAATFKAFPILYIFMLFAAYPGAFLGISLAFSDGTVGGTVGGVLALLALVFAHVAFLYWYCARGGHQFLVSRFGHDFDAQKDETAGDAKPTPPAQPESRAESTSSEESERDNVMTMA